MAKVYDDGIASIYKADARDLHEFVSPESVTLTVCSPPYNVDKLYHNGDNLPWPVYWQLMQDVFSDVYLATQPGGRCAVNVPMWAGKRANGFIPALFIDLLVEIGFDFKDWINWVKGESPEANSLAWGRFPVSPVIRSCSEVILIVRKPGRTITDVNKRDITMAEWQAWTRGVWIFPGTSNSQHPAPFPEILPGRLIKLYSGLGDLIIDPFGGSGSTAFMAKMLGRKAISCDVSPQYTEMMARRVSQAVWVVSEPVAPAQASFNLN